MRLYEERSGAILEGTDSSGFSNPGWEGILSSSGPTLYVEWSTDNADTDSGFVVNINAIDKNSCCPEMC